MLPIHRPVLAFGKSERARRLPETSPQPSLTEAQQQLLEKISRFLGTPFTARLNNHSDLVLIGPNARQEGARRIRFDLKMDPRGPHDEPHVHVEELRPDPEMEGRLRFMDVGSEHRYYPSDGSKSRFKR